MAFLGNVQLVRGTEQAIPSIAALLEQEGIAVTGNPDLYMHTYSHFGVDEARELSNRAQSRGVVGRRIFIIITAHLTTEAQNALLKTLEEPAADALFFIVVPSPETLLPTLRSRATTLEIARAQSAELIDVQTFLKANPEERITLLKPLLDKTDDDRRDIGSGIAFLADLERTLSVNPEKNREGLLALYRVRKYWTDKGSLSKALLEHVALLL